MKTYTTRPSTHGDSSSPSPGLEAKGPAVKGPAAKGPEQVEQMRSPERRMLCPGPPIKAKRSWKTQAAGPVLRLNFTPGGAHIIAVVQRDSAGRQAQELQLFETKTSREVVLDQQENRPPSYQTLRDGNGGNTSGYRQDPSTSAGQFILHPGDGFEESILRPDMGGSRLTVVDLYYPLDRFEEPDDALVTKLKGVQFPMAVSPDPLVLPGCDDVFAGVDTENNSVLRVFSWSADEHLLRQRRFWDFMDDEITHLEFTRDGRRIVCLTKNKCCRVVDIATDGHHVIPIPTTHEPEMLRTYQSPDGKLKVAVSIWQDLVVVSEYGGGHIDIYSLLGAMGRKVRALCLTKDCEFLACATDDGFDIFQPRSRRIVQKGLGRGLTDIRTGCFSDDGRHIAVADASGKIHLFQLSGSQWGK